MAGLRRTRSGPSAWARGPWPGWAIWLPSPALNGELADLPHTVHKVPRMTFVPQTGRAQVQAWLTTIGARLAPEI